MFAKINKVKWELDTDNLLNDKSLLPNQNVNLAHPYNRLLKRAMDLLLSVPGLILALPLCFFIAAVIYLSSQGPVLFTHRRIGKDAKTFPCYKFRTMIVGAEEKLKETFIKDPSLKTEWENGFKLKNDPRVTKIGKFLRKTSLDELPQLLNVLKGEMSLVGPRPITKEEIKKYGDKINDYYLVKPGLTGSWQVNGRSDTTYEERVQMDSCYIRNWSASQDLLYLFKTIGAVWRRKGAC